MGRSRAPASRWLALTVLCAAMMMIILDGTIVTVALPAIQRDLGFSSSGLAWVVNAYLIAFGGLLLLAGRLGDLIGGKRVFLAGLAVFVVASLICGVSVSQPMLIAARFAQGAGGAMASAVSLGMIVRLFPEPPLRARALGVYSFTGAGGASVGLVLGGVLTQALSWHWIFFVNVPIGAVAIVAGWLLLAGERGTGPRALNTGADAVGALLATAGLMTAVYAIAETSGYGWGSARTLGTGAVAVMLLAAFFARQHLARAPLLPLRIFRSRNVSGANVVQALTVAAAFGFQVLIPQYMQRVLGYGAAEAGVGMLPAAVVIGALSAGLSARLIGRFGLRSMLVAGLAPIVIGFALLTRLPVAGSYPLHLLPTMLLLGGFGLAFPAMITLAMSGVPRLRHRSGLRPGEHHPAGRSGAGRSGAVHPGRLADRPPDRRRPAGRRRADRWIPCGVRHRGRAGRGRARARRRGAAPRRGPAPRSVPGPGQGQGPR
jgi:EmrB/QacA subfamily drug resistance transporter